MMLTQLLLLILNTAFGFISGVLLLRFIMQWLRVPFRNPVGHFVLAVTDWLVRPARRFIPGLFGLDLASLLPAWLLQCALVALALLLTGVGFLTPFAPGLILVMGTVETVRLFIYLVIAAVIGVVVLSWVNPYSPLAPLMESLAGPFLRPFRRLIPLVGNVDLSPLVLLLVLQIALFLLDHMGRSVLAMVG